MLRDREFGNRHEVQEIVGLPAREHQGVGACVRRHVTTRRLPRWQKKRAAACGPRPACCRTDSRITLEYRWEKRGAHRV